MLVQLASWLLGLSIITLMAATYVAFYRIDLRSPYAGRLPGTLTPFQQADQRREWKKALDDPAYRADRWALYGLVAIVAASMTAAFVLIVAALSGT